MGAPSRPHEEGPARPEEEGPSSLPRPHPWRAPPPVPENSSALLGATFPLVLKTTLMAEVKVKVQPPDADPVEIENR